MIGIVRGGGAAQPINAMAAAMVVILALIIAMRMFGPTLISLTILLTPTAEGQVAVKQHAMCSGWGSWDNQMYLFHDNVIVAK